MSFFLFFSFLFSLPLLIISERVEPTTGPELRSFEYRRDTTGNFLREKGKGLEKEGFWVGFSFEDNFNKVS